jgi:hypothetical protein
VTFERLPVAEVGVQADPGVVDEYVERTDALDGGLDLVRIGHVQDQRRDALVRVVQRPPRTGVHALRTSA